MAEYFGILTNAHTRVYYAAMYEALQADKESHEAFVALEASGFKPGSPEDFALWSASAYQATAERLVRDLPVWEA